MEKLNSLSEHELQNKLEAMKLVESYAKDIVDSWETMSIRKLPAMTDKVRALKEALELVK